MSRKPYAAPVLTVYGSVEAMTQTNVKAGAIKDGGPNNTKS